MRDFKYKGYSSKELYSTVREKFVIEERVSHEDENLTSGRTYIYKPVRIKKINKITNEVVPFKKLDLDYLNRWILNNKDYEILEIDKYLYKAIFFPYADDYTKGAKEGYVDLKVRLYKNALSCILVSERTLTDRIIDNINDNEKYLCIDNKSNLEGLIIYPNFVISNIPRKGFKESRNIIIENTSITNNIINLSLEENEKIYINGKNDYIESNKNRLVNKIGDHIKLQNGINTIKIKSDGYTTITFSYQEEFKIEGAWNLE
ncbi:MAG: hypothetical protein E6300_16735 [Clostridium sp.]|uniref:hypothetical protein n=1 Tax=Clostridium sp. TaxID=1506 RepID=UPI0029100CC3|nr:hypothetical protein [Clostridium sp.]MDU7150123.1 hypothetical protein [Clostridium sp.]MDU7243376.1 hypothetical protein [Clostridium sp.]